MKFLLKSFYVGLGTLSFTSLPLVAQTKEAEKEETKEAKAEEKKAEPFSVTFRDKKFFHRHSQGPLHEFTPEGQEDLATWTDMLAIMKFEQFKTEEDLPKLANGLMNQYKEDGGKLFGFLKKEKTETSSTAYLGGVIFAKEGFMEYVRVRIFLHNGVGQTLIICHREYGETKDTMEVLKKWITDNEKKTTDAMWDFKEFPSDEKLAELVAKTAKELEAEKEKAEKK